MGNEHICNGCDRVYYYDELATPDCKCGRDFCSPACMEKHTCDEFYQRVMRHLLYAKDNPKIVNPVWVSNHIVCLVCGERLPNGVIQNYNVWLNEYRNIKLHRCTRCTENRHEICDVVFLPTPVIKLHVFAIFSISTFELHDELKNIIIGFMMSSFVKSS